MSGSTMSKRTRRVQLLPALEALSPAPVREFDRDRMVRMADCRSIIDVLRRIRYGGAEWVHRWVTLWIPGQKNAWILVYPLQDESQPYFDLTYTRQESPQETLSVLLEKHHCAIIDWSPGRLACIQTTTVDVEALARILNDVVEAVWGCHATVVDAAYEEMGRA